jgi:hypothetical protein
LVLLLEFSIRKIKISFVKFNLSNRPYMQWNENKIDTPSSTCFDTSWVPSPRSSYISSSCVLRIGSSCKAQPLTNKHTRAVRKVPGYFEYLESRPRGLDVTWQPVRGVLTVHPWIVTLPWG